MQATGDPGTWVSPEAPGDYTGAKSTDHRGRDPGTWVWVTGGKLQSLTGKTMGKWVLGGAGVQDDLVLEAMETGEPWKTWREEPMTLEVAMGTGLGRHVEEGGRDPGT